MACACSLKTTHTLKVKDIIKHSENAFSFDFESDTPFEWREGDYAKWFVDIDGSTVGQKFSFATLPEEKIVRFTTRIREERSDYKQELTKFGIGDHVEISVPEGNFHLRRNGKPALLLSNGVGIATMRSLIKAYERDASDVRGMTQINVDATESIYRAELDALAKKNTTFESIYTDHRSDFYEAVKTTLSRIQARTGVNPTVYVVGSYRFGEDVTHFLKASGIAQEEIFKDGQADGKGNCTCATVNRPINIQFAVSL